MSDPHIKFSCNFYKNKIFSGLSRLQEQQEFVDLTLAADSHFVKVHKNIIALASPYLKEMLQMLPTAHPIIFLNHVSYKILCYLLEYIYQGEVNVPEDSVESFLQVSKSLHINGMNDIDRHQANDRNVLSQQEAPQGKITVPPSCERFAAHLTIKHDHNLEVNDVDETLILDNVQINYNQPNNSKEEILHSNASNFEIMNEIRLPDNNMEIDNSLCLDQSNTLTKNSNNVNTCVENTLNPGTEPLPMVDLATSIKLDKEASDGLKIIPQYSITERGSLQIIVSRYIYCSHHNSRGGRKHRWRCIDYRKLRCPAFIDSFDGVIIKRKGLHNHAYHDNKIYQKSSRKLIFHTHKQAMEARDFPKNTEWADSGDIENAIEFNVVPKS